MLIHQPAFLAGSGKGTSRPPSINALLHLGHRSVSYMLLPGNGDLS